MPLEMRYAADCACGEHHHVLRRPTHQTTDHNKHITVRAECRWGRTVELPPVEISVHNLSLAGLTAERRQEMFDTYTYESERVLLAAVQARGATPIPPIRLRQVEAELPGEETWEWRLRYSIE